ncbi:MAG: helix-turn-helix domain-containing protein [Solirubrobacteraceae bacterium]
MLEELLTASQVAGLLQMRLSTVEDYARRGVLPSVKLGRHRRFIRSEIERAILSISEQGPRARGYNQPSAAMLRANHSGRTR